MGLPRDIYESILRDVDLPVLSCLHLGLLALKYPGVSQDTICAIFAQENQYKVLKSHHIHKAQMDTYCSRYLDGEDLLALCGDVDFPPCLMMRRMLEGMMGLSKQRVGDVLKQPALLQSVDAAAALQMWRHRTQQQHEQHAHQPQQPQQQRQPRRLQAVPSSSGDSGGINSSGGSEAWSNSTNSSSGGSSSSRWEPQWLLQCLQRDVVRCVHADRSYSPYCDMAKSLAGLEYEAFLYQQLSSAGVPFWSEQELRERGLFKTPDALLQVPICIRGSDGQWHMVHWIDSKASFGDDRTHTQQMEGQYATYVNRYGPGCVIYWLGYIADLSVSIQAQGGPSTAQHSAAHRGGEQQGAAEGVRQVDVLLLETFPELGDVLQLPHEAPSISSSDGGSSSTQGLPAAAAAAMAVAAGSGEACGGSASAQQQQPFSPARVLA